MERAVTSGDSPFVPWGEAADGAGTCTVTSQYQGVPPAVDQPTEVVVPIDGEPTTWTHDPGSTRWQTWATTSDTFTVTCDAPGAAEQVVRTASFVWRS